MTVIENVSVFLVTIAIKYLICWTIGTKKRTLYAIAIFDVATSIVCLIEYVVLQQIKKSTLILSGLFGIVGNLLSLWL
ncbi:MAG: hypothetical protein ACI4M5_06810 [Christensenellales bacterium]